MSSTSNNNGQRNRFRGTSVYSKYYSGVEATISNHNELTSLLGPPPDLHLGPKACICGNENVEHDDYQHVILQDPSNQFLKWKQQPKNILIIKKVNDAIVAEDSKQLARWLIKAKKMNVFVENDVLEEQCMKDDTKFIEIYQQLCIYKKDEEMESCIDLIICLGGDGTLLHTSSLFQESCPPVLSFHLGSLGFLMPFSFGDFENAVNQTLKENVGLTLRARLKSLIIENDDNEAEVKKEVLVLNEVVVDRGPVASVVNLDIICNGQYLTTLIGDGLVIATATGSTAYAAATGASMVHPNVPGIILAPICPHSLSFRPIVVPAGVELKIKVSPDSRRPAWASFDGRHHIELNKSMTIRITTSVYPIPCVSHKNHLSDWFGSLAECLHWNTRDSGCRNYKNKDSV